MAAKRRGELDDHFWPSWLEADIKGLSVYSVSNCAPISDFYGRAPHFFNKWFRKKAGATRTLNLVAMREAGEIFELLLTAPGLQTGPLFLIGHSLGGLVINQLIRTIEGEALVSSRTKR